MASPRPRAVPEPPPALERQALEELRYIRRTMEGAEVFTTASGAGQALIGLTALGAALLAHRQPDARGWLAVWLGEAALAFVLAPATMALKARRASMPLATGPARRFTASFALPVLAGVALTAALAASGAMRHLPGLWLLMFGTAVAVGGAFSVPVVRAMGRVFMALGVVTLFAPAAWGDALLATGFGGLLIGFGVWIAWRHGG